MTKITKEQLIQIGDLITVAVTSTNPAVKSLVDQLLTTVAIVEDLEKVRSQNPIVQLKQELDRTQKELRELKQQTQQDRVKKLVNAQYTWTDSYDEWSGKFSDKW